MSEKAPKTLPEWKAYAAGLKGAALYEAASSANTLRFVKLLQEEGYSPVDIHTILHLLARRFVEQGERPPMDGFYDLVAMAKEPAPQDV